jgi:hypothetical protein
MKNCTIIATLGAAAAVSMANAAVTTYTQFSNTTPPGWFQAVSGIAGGYYDPGTFSNWSSTSSTAGSAGFGWEAFTVAVTNGTVAFTTGNLVFTANATGTAMDVLFTFNRSGVGAPTATQGVYAFGINVSFGPSGNVNVGTDVNGVPVGNGAYPNSFVGLVGDTSGGNTNAPFVTARFTFQGGTTATVTGTQYGIVPAPGALALLGVAGIASARRRRA